MLVGASTTFHFINCEHNRRRGQNEELDHESRQASGARFSLFASIDHPALRERRAREFRHDRGFGARPLLLAGMVAVDTANLMRVRNNVQASLDAAALAVGKRFSTGESHTVVQDYGARIFTPTSPR